MIQCYRFSLQWPTAIQEYPPVQGCGHSSGRECAEETPMVCQRGAGCSVLIKLQDLKPPKGQNGQKLLYGPRGNTSIIKKTLWERICKPPFPKTITLSTEMVNLVWEDSWKPLQPLDTNQEFLFLPAGSWERNVSYNTAQDTASNLNVMYYGRLLHLTCLRDYTIC